MHGQDIVCGISKGTFEIPHKISYPYIERYDIHATLKFYKLLDLRASEMLPTPQTHWRLNKMADNFKCIFLKEIVLT